MLSYPNVVMPDAFTYLLRSNMQSSGKLFGQLQLYVAKRADLQALVTRCFRGIDPELRVEAIIKSLGWHGFRDHLAALYIERAKHGHYPLKLDAAPVLEIIHFEEKLKDFTVQGHSRAFLLAFYLKLMLLSASQRTPNTKLHDLLVREEVLAHLKYAPGRTIKIDFVLLLLQHFDHFFGRDTLAEYLMAQKSYEELYRKLSVEQKKILVQNLLSYGSSIGETEIFLGAGV